MKKNFIKYSVAVLIFCFLCCSGSKVLVIQKEFQNRPIAVNFLYEKGDEKILNEYYASVGSGESEVVNLLTTLIKTHSFDESDQINLKNSFIQSLEISKPFESINYVNTRDSLKLIESDYNIIVSYFGGSVSPSWKVKIGLGYEIFTGKSSESIVNKVDIIEKSSMTKSLGKVKEECIKESINKLFEYLEKL